MYVEAAIVKCPSCGKRVDVHIMSITSLIGPAAVECFWCGKVVNIDRIEWWEMNGQAKAWFFGVSLLYVGLGYILGGLSTDIAIRFLETGQWRNELWNFGIGGGAWALFVGLIQVYRVGCSLQRRKEIELKPLRRSFWSFHLGGQWKVLVLLMLIPTLCWLVAVLREISSRFEQP